MNDKKTLLNYQLTGVLDDLSDMIKDENTPFEAFYQPLRQVVDLLGQGASINTQNKRGETLLHLACYYPFPLYGVEPYTFDIFHQNAKAVLKDTLSCLHIAGEMGLKTLAYPFSKQARLALKLLKQKFKYIFFRDKKGPKSVALPIEKIVTTYHPNPFLVDKRMNTPAMALTRTLRSPVVFDKKDKVKLQDRQLEYKYEELNILEAYTTSFQAQQTARALKSLMVLASLTDKEKVSANMPKVSRDIINMTEHQDSRVSPATSEQAERLIKTIIKATNNLSGVSDKTNQNEG